MGPIKFTKTSAEWMDDDDHIMDSPDVDVDAATGDFIYNSIFDESMPQRVNLKFTIEFEDLGLVSNELNSTILFGPCGDLKMSRTSATNALYGKTFSLVNEMFPYTITMQPNLFKTSAGEDLSQICNAKYPYLENVRNYRPNPDTIVYPPTDDSSWTIALDRSYLPSGSC